jgi:putative salt-induced outer membrane protein YdiY
VRHTALFIAVSLALLLPVAVVAEPVESLTNEDETPTPGLFGTSFLEGWTRTLGIGLSGSAGPTDEFKLIADAGGEYEDERHRRKISSQFYLSKVDSKDTGTDRKAYVEYEENWMPFANYFFLLGLGRYDNDRLEAWDHRISVSIGIGTELYSTEKLELRASVGGGLNHVWDLDSSFDATQTSPEGVLRLDGSYEILEDTSFSTTHTYYPNFNETPHFRLISDAEFKADIGGRGGLTASLGITNEYDSLAVDENNDLTYYLRLGYDF